ncbi:phage tail assembly chaperone [Pseudomonas qingdaonensis]|uniref:phage tail assembly chaperone n=1 Tax=Pseudomonas qingdaonensis TaxID=2056231 RepID=UPI00333EC325
MWALVVGDKVIEVTPIDPVGRFHPALNWLPCAADVVPGFRLGDKGFEPAPEGDRIAAEREWRDAQVSGTEWLVNRHRDEQDMQLTTTLQSGQFADLLQYRQALRDWPQSELFPVSEHRPVPPLWLESITP